MRRIWTTFNTAPARRGGFLALAAVLLLCLWGLNGTARAAESTYLFEVTTGAKTGDEGKIDFFVISYTTKSSQNETTSKFLVPRFDGWEQTYDTLVRQNNAQASIDATVSSSYGYAGTNLRTSRQIFQAYSTDQYLFTTNEPIQKITRVQFYARQAGSWDCRSMRIFQVNQLGGLYRWNTASNDCYIDFDGDLIAEGSGGSVNIAWDNNKVISTKSAQDQAYVASVDIALKTSGFNAAYAHHNLQDNTKKTLALRLNFADTYGSGLESLGARSASGNKLRNMGLAETMAVTLYYIDCYGMEHAANIPAVLNAAEYTYSLLPEGDRNKPISGLGQQGEGLTVGIFLPDFVSLVESEGITLTLGSSEAKSALGLTAENGKPSGEPGRLRTDRIKLSESDSAEFVTLALYDLSATDENGNKKVRVSARVSETTKAVEYVFEGKPSYYQPVTTPGGNSLYVGKNKINLTPYDQNADKRLAPRDSTERYLLELTTDDVIGAGTKDDIMLSISWLDLEGNAKVSDTLNLRELSRDFYGWWYGSRPEDMGYYRGVAQGQTLRLFVPLQYVRAITDIKVWMGSTGNHDDWQMKDLSISTVEGYENRVVYFGSYSIDGVTSSLRFDRTVQGTEVYRFTDTATNPVLVQQDADEYTDVGPGRVEYSGSGEDGARGVDVVTKKKLDWSRLRYSMTFQEASQELGFLKDRCLYAVTVHVAGNSEANAEDGDCGSKNLFYFQLVFKNGVSSFVLANQQLPSDGFIAGASQTFHISTNDDYGDVTAVQIIPEDLSEDSDLFDKLNIESIEIKRESSSALVPVWTISSVGWISIDYRDNGQMQSVTGMAGRGAEELTRTYTVDGSTFDVNFMLAITTEGYPAGAPQLEGNLSATVYYDSYTPSKGYAQLSDVTKSMYSYMNHSTRGAPESTGGKTISDPSLMFRPDSTDRFYFSLSNVRSIKRIELEVTSTVNTIWKISDVSLFMVNGEGALILNSKGEYQRVYRAGEELTKIAYGNSENAPAYAAILQPYDGSLNSRGQKLNGRPTVINVGMTENSIPVNPDATQWTSVVTREPVSENDTLNLFLYPESGKTDTVNGLKTSIQYATTDEKFFSVSTGVMSAAVYNGQEVYFSTGIGASRMKALNAVTVYGANGGKGVSGGSVRAVIQRVRSGVVINTWDLSGSGYTDPAGITLSPTSFDTAEQQRLYLQLGNNTDAAVLSAEKNNLAVALYYRADDPSGMELRSPYVYLTDQGYTQIRPGEVIGLTFNQLNIAEVTGLSLVSAGDVNIAVDGARVVDETVNLITGAAVAAKGVYSFTERFTATKVPYRANAESTGLHSMKPLSLTFVTAATASEDVSAGTNAPVRMTLGYYDVFGDLNRKTYDDIRSYISDGATGFASGSTVHVDMLVPDVDDLRWIELEPYDGASDPGEQSAQTRESGTGEAEEGGEIDSPPSLRRVMWMLESLTVSLADGEFEKNCAVGAQIIQGEPLHLNMADILVAANVYVSDMAQPQVAAGGSLDLLIPSGKSIRVVPRLIGSYEGFQATLMKLDSASGAVGMAYLDDTRGYTEESIATKAAAAADSREAAIWRSAKPETGSFEIGKTDINFTPPRNYTDRLAQYQIVVSSVESSSSTLTINVTVENEKDPVAQQLDELYKTMDQERLERMQQQIDAMNAAEGAEFEAAGE